MDRLINLAKQAAEKIKNSDNIEVVSHIDCDGITSAAIMKESLERLGKKFEIRIVRHIKSDLIDELNKKNLGLIIFTDLGSGYLEELKRLKADVIIADHHAIKNNVKNNFIHLNPGLFDIKSLSGSCVTYLIARELGNQDLSPIAIIGAIGDLEDIDEDILKEAEKFGIKKQRGLKFFGKNRPIHKVLEYSFDPVIPGISGDESASIQFLSKLGIKIKENGKWRTLNDLTKEELQKLSDGLIVERIKNGKKAETIFADNYVLKDIFDVKEFATVINASGRLGEYETGINLCLGKDENIENIMRKYKRILATSIDWVKKSDNIRKNATYVIAGDNIGENFIGTVISICIKSFDLGDIVIGFANAEDGVKVSARTLKDIDLNELVSEVCYKVGGSGGGHTKAAGGMIPVGKEKEFIEVCEEMLEKQL